MKPMLFILLLVLSGDAVSGQDTIPKLRKYPFPQNAILKPDKRRYVFMNTQQYKSASDEEKIAYIKQIFAMEGLKKPPGIKLVRTVERDANHRVQVKKGGAETISTKYIQPADPAFKKDPQDPARECQAPGKIEFSVLSSELAYTQTSQTGALYLGQVFDIGDYLSTGQMNHLALPMRSCMVSIGTLGTENTVDAILDSGKTFTHVKALFSGNRDVIDNLSIGSARSEFFVTTALSKNLVNASLGFHYSDVVGNEANVNSNFSTGATRKAYCATYQQEYYRASIVPNNADGRLFDMNAFPEAYRSNRNLVYVSEIVYGRMGFLNLDSDSNYFNTRNSLGGTYSDGVVKVSGNVSFDLITNDESASIYALTFGGSEANGTVTGKESFINWVNSSGNIPYRVVIGYKLRFVSDELPATILSYGRDPIQVCKPVPVADDAYDIEVSCEELQCTKSFDWPWDSDDEIYGQISWPKYTIRKNGTTRTHNVNYNFWKKSFPSYRSFDTGDELSINKSKKIRNISPQDIFNLKVFLAAKFYDEEWDRNKRSDDIRYDPCTSCDNNYLYEIDMSRFQDQIQQIRKGTSAKLTFANDMDLLKLRCRENKQDAGSATMTPVFTVRVYRR